MLRVLAVVGQHAFIYVDSIDYETLDFSGDARRPWVTPLLYRLVGDHALRILSQGMIGALCWSYLALQAAALMHDRRAQWGAAGSILLLSLTTTVTNWDTTMLSESLALSTTALVLGTLLKVWRDPSYSSVGLAASAWLVWLFTRQNHLVLAILVIATLTVLVGTRWLRTRTLERPPAALLGLFAAVTFVGGVAYSHNTEILHYNLAQVIGNRVFTDPDKAAWFSNEGMPLPDAHPVGPAVAPQDLLADEDFAEWIDTEALGVYARYLMAHPWYSLTGVLDDLASERAPFGELERPDEVMLATPDAYGVGRQVIPEPVEDILFEPGSAGMVVFTVFGTLALTLWRWRTRGPDPRWLVPLLAIALQWPALTAVWHASTAELGRLALPSSIILRVGLLIQLALVLDAWLGERAERGTP